MNPISALPACAARALVVVLLAFLAVPAACVTKKTLGWQWAQVEPSWEKAGDDADSAGVVLLAEQRFVFQRLGSYGERSEVHFHIVQKLLTEAGIDALAGTVPWPKKGTLLHLDARTVSPDGTITAVTEEELFADEVKFGKGDDGEENSTNVRRFTFPRVEVGSILELSWAFEMPGLYTGWSDTRILGDLPIKKYRVEIVVDQAARPDLMVVNRTVPPRLVEEGDGMQHLVLELEDLPARHREAYAPSPRTSEPWWMYRTIAYRSRTGDENMNASWNDVASRPLYRLLVKGEGKEGIALRDAATCAGSTSCLVDKALEQVRESAAWSGHDWPFDFRAPNEIEASGEATSAEKAALLWALLDSAGVPARLAALSRAHTNEVDKTFPHLAWLNHTLVVAKVDGEDVWLDPACEHCARGELPSWSRNRDALVAFVSDKRVRTEWKRATGKVPAAPDVNQSRYEVKVAEDGTVEVSFALRSSGTDALDDCRSTRHFDDVDWQQRAAANVRAWSLAGVLVDHAPGTCRKAEGTYARELRARLPSFAARSGERILVPLSFLGGPVDLPRHEPRKRDFVVREPQRWEDELAIVPPPGWTFAAPPPAFVSKAKGATATLKVERDGEALVLRRVVTLDAGVTARDDVKALRTALDAAADVAWRTVTLVKASP